MEQKIKILLLENNPFDAELIAQELTRGKLDFELVIADNKAAFASALIDFSFDIILFDTSLPCFDAFEALLLLKEAGITVPFIIITAGMTDDFALDILKHGAQDYIYKDRLLRLPSAITNSIEKYHLAVQQQVALERIRFHMENTTLGYIEWDSELHIRSISQRTEEIFGWTLAELSSMEKSNLFLVYDEDKTFASRIAADLFRGISKRNTAIHRNVTKDGKVIWCEWFNSVQQDKSGKVCTILSLVQDVTIRKQAEQQLTDTTNSLQQALSDLNKTLDSSLDVICSINKDGKFESVSSAAEKIWGYTPVELSGRKYIELVFSEDVQKTTDAAAKLGNGMSLTLFENRYVRKNGSVVPMLWSARWDEKDNLLYCIAKDATEKKNLESAIENERRRFIDLFSEAPSCMGILKGPNHVFELANPQYLKLIGKENIIGKPVLAVLPEIAEQGFISMLDNVYTTGETFAANEMCIKLDKAGDGKLVDLYLNFIYQAYKNNEGKIDGIFFFAIDVSEQVISRKIIEKSESRYRQIVETAQEGIWMIDKNNRTTFANRKLCEMLEYTPEEMKGKENTFFMDQQGIEIAAKAAGTRKIGVPEKLDICLVTKSEKKIWVTLSGSALTDQHGQFISGLSMVTDITEKRKVEEQLARKQSRLNQAQAIAHLGSWELNFVANEVWWSEEGCRIYGLPAEAFIQSFEQWVSYIHPEDTGYVMTSIAEAHKTFSDSSFYYRIVLQNGTIKHIHSESKFEFDDSGKAIGLSGIVHDVTAVKIAEDRLRKSESSLKEAQAIAHLGNWEIDLPGNVETWSDGLYKLLGITKEDVKPSSELFLSFVHPDDINFVRKKLYDSFKTLQNCSFELRFIRHDGKMRYGYSEWEYEFDKSSNPIRMFGIVQDITERKVAEAERTTMFNTLTLRNKDLEQFTYIVSHNLRAPVANILGASSALSEPGLDTGSIAILSKGLNQSVVRLDNVVKDLNHILQVKGQLNETKEQVCFSALVEDIKLSIWNLIENRDITIRYNFSQVDEFTTVKSYLYSIFFNLISNSIKYRRPQIPCLLDINSHKENHKIAIRFSDNGMGIDLQKRGDQVFGLYKRFHPQIEGKGMGLFMTKTQVESLGGQISIQSNVNKGTDFEILFDT